MPVRRIYITERNVCFQNFEVKENEEYTGFWHRIKKTKTETTDKKIFSVYPSLMDGESRNFERDVMQKDYENQVSITLDSTKVASDLYKILKTYLLEFEGYKIEHSCGNHIVFDRY